MFQKQHTANAKCTNEALSSINPSPLVSMGVHVTPETRIALHHMAGEKGTTIRRLLRQILENAVTLPQAIL